MIHELSQQSEDCGLIPRNTSSAILFTWNYQARKEKKRGIKDWATSPQACIVVWILCVSSLCGQLERKDSFRFCFESWVLRREVDRTEGEQVCSLC